MLSTSLIIFFLNFIDISQDSQLCLPDKVYVLSENQVLAEYYREIVAAMMKGYMLIQMSYMISTLKSLGGYGK